MTIIEFTTRLCVALAAGLLIGLERQWRQKSAGLRTNTLVAVGAAIYVLLSINLTTQSGDVTRIIAQVVTGIGFLGAGVIIHQGTDIRGLTTAATIWCSSAVGCLAASGKFIETLICTIAVLFINAVLVLLEGLFPSKETQE